MAKKNKKFSAPRARVPAYKRPSAVTILSGEEVVAKQGLTLEGLRIQVADGVAGEHWGKLLELSATAPEKILDVPVEEAEYWLLSTKVVALTKANIGSLEHVESNDRPTLKVTLMRMSELASRFHKATEFTPYLQLLDFTIEDAAQGLLVLVKACQELSNFWWIEKLRSCAYILMFPEEQIEEGEEQLTQAQRALIDALPEVDLLLKDAYACAENSHVLVEEDKVRLAAYQTELAMKMATPGDVQAVRNAIAKLPAPTLSANLIGEDVEEEWRPRETLTPAGWGLLWELQFSGPEQYEDLLEQYPGPFGNDLCDGLAALIQSTLKASDAEADKYFISAVNYLSRYHQFGDFTLGDSLMVELEDGTTELPIGYHNLRRPRAAELLQQMVERIPKTYQRSHELWQFYRMFAQALNGRHLKYTEEPGMSFDDMTWLRSASCRFQWMARDTTRSYLDDVRYLFGALTHPLAGAQLRGQTLRDYGVTIEADQIPLVLESLEAVVSQRTTMKDSVLSIWKACAVPVFDSLLEAKVEYRSQLLRLSQECSSDLTDRRGLFIRGYIEQVAGDPNQALCEYLDSLALAPQGDTTIGINAALLWAKETNLEIMQEHVQVLRECKLDHPAAIAVHKDLLASAEKRLKFVRQGDQHERTAVNRWPKLSSPARTVLSTLHQIDGFQDYEELGKYAGMTAHWVEVHHRKLREEGMVLSRNGEWYINPHIVPLLERENQHAVVGRIVRSQGTTAIKQVFNSKREYSIYQVVVQLCPNHLVFPNCALQSVMSFDRMKELVDAEDFGYYLRASVDLVVVSSTTYLPLLAIEVDSAWHDTERQQERDDRKDRLFGASGIPFLRLRPMGQPTPSIIRGEVAAHLSELINTLRTDIPGYDQAERLLQDLAGPEELPDLPF